MRSSATDRRGLPGLMIVQVLATGLTYPILSAFGLRLRPPAIVPRLSHLVVPEADLGLPLSPEAIPAAAQLEEGLGILGGVALSLALLTLLVGCATAGTLVHRRWVDRLSELGIRAAVGARRQELTAHVMGPLWRRLLVGAALGTALGVTLASVLRLVLPEALLLSPVPFSSPAVVAVAGPVLAAWSAARFDVRRALRRFSSPLRLATPTRLAPVWGGGAYYGILIAVLATAGVLVGGSSSSDVAAREWAEAADTLLFEVDASVTPERALSTLDALRAGAPAEEWQLVSAGALEGLGTRDVYMVECDCVLGTVVSPYRRIEAQRHAVTSGVFASLGISVSGREFTPDDGPDSEGVVLIDRGLVPRWGGADPLGKMVRVAGTAPDAIWYRIVGIVDMPESRDVASTNHPLPEMYFSALQHPPSRAQLAVRGVGGPPDESSARRTLDEAAAVAGAPVKVSAQGTLSDRLALWRAPIPLFGALLAIVAAAAFALGVLGVSTLAWLDVRSRTPEFGIRRAVGAHRWHIRRHVFVEVLQIAGVGIAFGSILGRGFTAGLADRYAAVEGASSGLLLLAGATLTVAALLSSLRPAARAVRVSPIDAIGDVE